MRRHVRVLISWVMLFQIIFSPLARAAETNASQNYTFSNSEAGHSRSASLTYELLNSARNTAKYDADIVGPYSNEIKSQYKNLVGFPISSANMDLAKTNVLWSQDMQLGFTVEEKGQFKTSNPLYAYDKKNESDFIRSIYKFFSEKQIDQMIQGQIQATNKKYEDYNRSGKAIDYLKGKASTIKEASIRFPKDTALFFVAIGLVMYNQLYFHYEGNPIAMEQHVASLSDPIANLAFYSFIVANSLSNEAFTRTGYKKLDLAKRVKAFKVLNYKSLFWGMLASNIVADVGYSIKACSDKISGIDKASGEESLITACGEAMRMWTAPKVVNRYTPLIASLMISQKISEELMRGASALKNLSSRVGVVFQGLSFALRSGPAGKIYVIGASAVTMVVTFAVFVQIDHVVQPIVNTIYNVIAYPFRRFDNALNLSVCSKYFKNNYQVHPAYIIDKNKIASECEEDFVHKVLDWRDFSNEWRNSMNGKFETGYMMWSDMITTIFNQYAAAEAYYLTFLQELEGDRASRANGNTPTINDRNHFSRVHYLNGVLVKPSYISREDQRNISELSLEEKNKLKEVVIEDRLLKPGVLDYGMLDDEGKYINNGRIGLIKEAIERPGLFPDTAVLQKSKYTAQKVKDIGYCLHYSENCKMKIYQGSTTEADQTVAELLKQIKNDLTAEDLRSKGLGLYKLNILLKVLDRRDILAVKLTEFRNYLGAPEPIFSATAAFPYVYSNTSSNKDSLENSKFSYPSKYVGSSYIKTDKFDNAAYYFTHEMICGPEKAQIQHSLGFKASFVPPNILKKSLDKNSEEYLLFCNAQTSKSDTDKVAALNGKSVRKSVISKEGGNANYRYNFNKTFNLFGLGEVSGPVGIILQNSESQLLSELIEKDESGNTQSMLYFVKWWYENSFKPFEKFIDQQNNEYKKLYAYLENNLNNNTDLISTADLVDTFQYPFKLIGKNWTDAGYNVVDSLKFELQQYLVIVESIARDQDSVDMLNATRKRYDRIFSYLINLHGFSNKNKTEKQQKVEAAEIMKVIDENKMGLRLSFLSNEAKSGQNAQDQKTFHVVAMGLESIDANLRKYVMAKSLLEYDSKESVKQLFENQKAIQGIQKPQKNGSTGR